MCESSDALLILYQVAKRAERAQLLVENTLLNCNVYNFCHCMHVFQYFDSFSKTLVSLFITTTTAK